MRPNGEAEALLNSPLLKAMLATMEADAVETAVSARPEDDDKRLRAMIRVQVIRNIRQDLRLYAEGKAPAPTDAG